MIISLFIAMVIGLAMMNFSDDEAIMVFGSFIGCIAFIGLVILGCKNMGLL